MKKISLWWWVVGIVIIIAGLFSWSRFLQVSDPNVIAANGMHWHPRLAIYVGEELQSIPANLGLGPSVHQPMHTHAEDAKDGVLHLEFGGTVHTDDVRLGKFFQMWGKNMSDFGENMRMTVNGDENTEYENYIMQDGDIIELHFD
jgi:hypothetical protein